MPLADAAPNAEFPPCNADAPELNLRVTSWSSIRKRVIRIAVSLPDGGCGQTKCGYVRDMLGRTYGSMKRTTKLAWSMVAFASAICRVRDARCKVRDHRSCGAHGAGVRTENIENRRWSTLRVVSNLHNVSYPVGTGRRLGIQEVDDA